MEREAKLKTDLKTLKNKEKHISAIKDEYMEKTKIVEKHLAKVSTIYIIIEYIQ